MMTSQRTFDRLAIALVAGGTLALETALAQRKFGIFTGGFGATKVLDTPAKLIAFAIGAVAAQVLLVGLGFVLIRAIERRAKPAVVRLDFLALVGGALTAWIVGKFEVLAYFSDAISFKLIARLGGGSLFDAFLFALSEGGLMIGAAVGGILAWLILRWIVARRAAPSDGTRLKLKWPLAVLAAALPLIVFGANTLPDARYALNRMTAYGLANIALDQATDFDRDGYSWFSAQIDHYPFDASRHPLALDIPGNGVDEDGFGGDFRFTGGAPIVSPPTLPARKKNLVIIVLESTRFDVLHKALNGQPVSPNLRAIAAAGSSFPLAYSHVGYTTESLKSLFSGQLVPQDGAPSLFTDLKANGYRIGVFSGQPESFGGISETVGMKKSADIYIDAQTLKTERAFSFAAEGSLLLDESKLLREFDRRMGNPAEWKRPHFLYFNFQSAHFPYHHLGMTDRPGVHPLDRSDIDAQHKGRVADTYYNAVAYADMRIGQVVARLKALGVWDDTVLMVTGDHGEALFDDGALGHGHIIDPIQFHIPFVINRPGLSTPAPLGLKDMRGILLNALGGGPAPVRSRPAFMHIGPLDAPAAIGIADAKGVFTTMSLDTEEVWFSDTKMKARYATLTGAQKARADALITEWERQRWQRHLAGSN